MSRYISSSLLAVVTSNSVFQYEEVTFPASNPTNPYPGLNGMTVGQGFYDIISHLPSGKFNSYAPRLISAKACSIGTRVYWGVNLRQHNLTATYLETKALVQAFESPAVKENGITLNFIELGNEADAYNEGGDVIWNVTAYVPQ